MPLRSLLLAAALTGGDYLLWEWSLGSNDTALAIVTGLALPPLAIALLWALALSAAHGCRLLMAGRARHQRAHRRRGRYAEATAPAVIGERDPRATPSSDRLAA